VKAEGFRGNLYCKRKIWFFGGAEIFSNKVKVIKSDE
jgi:hypothetical protein